MGFKNETMNLFKLKLYNWNLNDAALYYQNDKFCLDYSINKNYKYGCRQKQCLYKHSINLPQLISGNSQPDYKQGELLCLYLMYNNVFNDNNPELFNMYAVILCETGKSQQDYLNSEKYFLKSLAIDNNNPNTHNDYGILLHNKLQNYDKAEYHYNQSLIIDPNDAMGHCNFALFLINERHKYELALSHSEKKCELAPNLSVAYCVKAKSLYKLNRFDLSLKEYQICLKLNEKDPKLGRSNIKDIKEQIRVLTNKTLTLTTKKNRQNSQTKNTVNEKREET